MNSLKFRQLKETLFKGLFFLAALFFIFALGFICFYIFGEAVKFFRTHSFIDFIFGMKWAPEVKNPSFGIFPFIMGSVYMTLLAALIGVPLSLFTAAYLAFDAPPKWKEPIFSSLKIMASIPSVVYGLFALTFLVPIMRSIFPGNGMNIMTAGLLLSLMILPTITSVAYTSLEAVPKIYYEASQAMGAKHSRTVTRVMMPAAKSGIIAAVILGIGRAIGETMAVVLIAGNQPRLTFNPFEGTRSLTTNIVIGMAYASQEHTNALLASAAVLFFFILIINVTFFLLQRKAEKELEA